MVNSRTKPEPLLRSVVGSSHGQDVYLREFSSTNPRKPPQQWRQNSTSSHLCWGVRSKPFPQARSFPHYTDSKNRRCQTLYPSRSKIKRRKPACVSGCCLNRGLRGDVRGVFCALDREWFPCPVCFEENPCHVAERFERNKLGVLSGCYCCSFSCALWH